MRTPTRVVGDSTLAEKLVVSTAPCKLYSIRGQNTNAGTRYIQVHQTKAEPSPGAVPIFSIPVLTNQYYSDDYGAVGADLDCLTIVSSTTAATYTAGSADATFQAILHG